VSIIASAGPVAPGRIEFHVAGEWTGVYLDGKLIRVGDSYLADEWLQSFVGVKYVDDDAFMLGQNGYDGVAQTLDEVATFAAQRDANRAQAAALRDEARRLEAQAKELEK